jgi:hypothetical protein
LGTFAVDNRGREGELSEGSEGSEGRGVVKRRLQKRRRRRLGGRYSRLVEEEVELDVQGCSGHGMGLAASARLTLSCNCATTLAYGCAPSRRPAASLQRQRRFLTATETSKLLDLTRISSTVRRRSWRSNHQTALDSLRFPHPLPGQTLTSPWLNGGFTVTR